MDFTNPEEDMQTMTRYEIRVGVPEDVAKALDEARKNSYGVDTHDLAAALANVLDRVAALETIVAYLKEGRPTNAIDRRATAPASDDIHDD